MVLKIKSTQVIEVSDWDNLVEETYSKPYNFQQQDDCKPRGVHYLSVPSDGYDYENDTILEKVNGPEMGVSFKAWLARDPKTPLENNRGYDWETSMWWERNFYPSVDMIANDLHSKGLLPEGEYVINIDW